jgi:hypothetical protein
MPASLRAPDNSMVCYDFAACCRLRLSVARDARRGFPGKGSVQIARFVDSLFILNTEADRGSRWAAEIPDGSAIGTRRGASFGLTDRGVSSHRPRACWVHFALWPAAPRRATTDPLRGPPWSSRVLRAKNPRPDSDSTVEWRDARPRNTDRVECPGSFPSTTCRTADWCGIRRSLSPPKPSIGATGVLASSWLKADFTRSKPDTDPREHRRTGRLIPVHRLEPRVKQVPPVGV